MTRGINRCEIGQYAYSALTLNPTMCYHDRTLGKREDIMWLALFWLLGLIITIIMQVD